MDCVQRGPGGGNPAGVWIGTRFPQDEVMQRIAADVGYSETAFLTREHLDSGLYPDLAHAGAWHLVVPLRSRDDLACLHYDFDRLARIMTEEQLTTVQVIWREDPHHFHARKPHHCPRPHLRRGSASPAPHPNPPVG